MVHVSCPNCGETMDMTEEDSRDEWYEATYHCEGCNKTKIHRREFDQNGLVTFDEVQDK